MRLSYFADVYVRRNAYVFVFIEVYTDKDVVCTSESNRITWAIVVFSAYQQQKMHTLVFMIWIKMQKMQQ